MAAIIYFKKSENKYYRVVEDGVNSATFEITANDDYFESIKQVETDVSTYDDMTALEWDTLTASLKDAVDFALEFVGGFPPHMPQPSRPK